MVDIALITIIREEYEALHKSIEKLSWYESEVGGGNLYGWMIGQLPYKNSGRMYEVSLGLVAQAGQASCYGAVADAIKQWDPNWILIVGIAGGIPKNGVALGDVVVASTIWNYSYGKASHLFEPRHDFTYQVDKSILRAAISCDIQHKDKWKLKINERPVGGGKPRLLHGPVASGTVVVDAIKTAYFAQVLKAWPKLVAIEMEGGGAAEAIESAHAQHKMCKFGMIRGISDLPSDSLSENNAHLRDEWKDYAAYAAAQFCIHLIQWCWPSMPKSMNIVSVGKIESRTTSNKDDIYLLKCIKILKDDAEKKKRIWFIQQASTYKSDSKGIWSDRD